MNRIILSIRGLVATYGDFSGRTTELRFPDLDVFEGEKVALTGPSGSGKTTLLLLIAGLKLPREGTVRVCDCDITRLSEEERDVFRARNLGIVFQSLNLLESSSLLTNVCLQLWVEDRRGKSVDRWARGLLKHVGLEGRVKERPTRLSSGERQRVAVARAVAGGSRLLLADEPTSHLDTDNSRRVLDLLFEGVQRWRKTLLVVTHDERILGHFNRVISLAPRKECVP
ncbi:MAG: ATP-binding cassette domain-containing protein [Candidatus Hydrogenedentota bacterium]|nr:MAG: ATP-binding cassette domain-containing protein [Candidatus Hydrogenedentota bacterium]